MSIFHVVNPSLPNNLPLTWSIQSHRLLSHNLPLSNSFLVVPSGCLLKRGSSKANWFLRILFSVLTLRKIIPPPLSRGYSWTLYAATMSNTQLAQHHVPSSMSPVQASRQGFYAGRSVAPHHRQRLKL